MNGRIELYCILFKEFEDEQSESFFSCILNILVLSFSTGWYQIHGDGYRYSVVPQNLF